MNIHINYSADSSLTESLTLMSLFYLLCYQNKTLQVMYICMNYSIDTIFFNKYIAFSKISFGAAKT